MNNREINETRTKLLMKLAEAGRAALEFDPLATSALAAIPDTNPQQYVAAGTLKMIAKVLPTVDAPAVQAHAELTDERIDSHIIKSGVMDKAWPTQLALHAFARAIESELRAGSSDVRNEALEEVAKLIEKKVEAYDHEHGCYDHTTGVTEYPGDGGEWVCEMEELAEEIRALKSEAPAASKEGGEHV
jgi:hypothetical protein